MMLTRFIKTQLFVFLALTVAALLVLSGTSTRLVSLLSLSF